MATITKDRNFFKWPKEKMANTDLQTTTQKTKD
jgi:hypothetical protein